MILGFSGKALSGKDTAADYIISRYGWAQKLGFSYNLKDACIEIFGLSRKQVYDQDGKSTPLSSNIVVDFSVLSYIIEWMNRTHPISIYSHEYKHLLGKVLDTPREVLQFVGTDVMRYYCPSYHVDVALLRAKELDSNSSVAFVDVRFPNEASGIKSIGGLLVRIVRPDSLRCVYGGSSLGTHQSEVALDNKNDWDYNISNDTSDLSIYYNKLDTMLKILGEKTCHQ